MPLFLCRWPNGDCSVVWARNKEGAIEALDQVGNAEGCPITPIHEFQIHFALTDLGELALEGLGDGTGPEIVAWAYPVLDRALAGDCLSTAVDAHPGNGTFHPSPDFTANGAGPDSRVLRRKVQADRSGEESCAGTNGGNETGDWRLVPTRERRRAGLRTCNWRPSTDHGNPGNGTFHLSPDFPANGADTNSRVLHRKVQANRSGKKSCSRTKWGE